MRIAFDMLIVEQVQNEALQTTCTLLSKLAILDTTHEYIVITGQPEKYHLQKWAENAQLHPVKISTKQGILTQHQLLLPGILRHLQPDILHVPNAIAPIGWNGPFIVTIHNPSALDEDLQASQQHALIYWQRLLRESLKQAQCILIVSEHQERIEHICAELNTKWLEEEKRIYAMHSETLAQVALHAYNETLEQVYRETAIAPAEADRTAPASNKDSQHGHERGQREQKQTAYPDVSVIIPSSRLEKAEQALEALSQQQYMGKLEILVVGPPARQLETSWPIHVIHPEAVYRPGKARNLGAAQASGEILLFLDDDMLVAADWVKRNVQALQQTQVGAVGARMPGKAQTFYARCTDFTNYGRYQHKRPMDEPLGSGSISIYKTLFIELGGFDEELYASEDIELCYRLHQRGYHTMYRPEIIVIHDHHQDTLRKLLNYNYIRGYQSGLAAKLRQHDKKLQKRLIAIIMRYPLLFFPMLSLLALLGTLKIVSLNIHDHRHILLYSPFIFLGKLAYQSGVFMCLLKGEKRI